MAIRQRDMKSPTSDHRKKILIADTPEASAHIRHILQEHVLFRQSHCFADAVHALHADLDLVICGVNLRGCMPFAIQAHCQRQAGLRHIPILFINMTGDGMSIAEQNRVFQHVGQGEHVSMFDYAKWSQLLSESVVNSHLRHLVEAVSSVPVNTLEEVG